MNETTADASGIPSVTKLDGPSDLWVQGRALVRAANVHPGTLAFAAKDHLFDFVYWEGSGKKLVDQLWVKCADESKETRSEMAAALSSFVALSADAQVLIRDRKHMSNARRNALRSNRRNRYQRRKR